MNVYANVAPGQEPPHLRPLVGAPSFGVHCPPPPVYELGLQAAASVRPRPGNEAGARRATCRPSCAQARHSRRGQSVLAGPTEGNLCLLPVHRWGVGA